jgi:hypothetical protein
MIASNIKFLLIAFAFFSVHSVNADETAERLQILFTSGEQTPEGDLKREQSARQFLKDERDQIAMMLTRLGPDEPVAGWLASSIAYYSEPSDYLIIVTGFLNEIGKGNFDAVKGHSVVSDLLFPEHERLVGLIAMNYQLPELNEALRRAEPRLLEDSNSHKFVKNVLSGGQKELTISSHESQGLPLPAKFSSLYLNGKWTPKNQGEIAGDASTPTTQEKPFSPISESPQLHSQLKLIWWTIGAFALFIVIARVLIRRKK